MLLMGAWGLTPVAVRAQAVVDTMAATVPGRLPPLQRPTWTIQPTRGEIAVDGRLDDGAWRGALEVTLDWEVRPAENDRAPVLTRCFMTYDANALYLGCDARDPDPEAIRAWVVDRDGIEGHDRVILTLDPFNDQRRAFQFGISALGVQYDAVLAQQGTGGPQQGPDAAPVDPSWDAIWRSAGVLTETGYTVEAAVPFRALRFPTTDGPATWGMSLSRWWPRSDNVEMRTTPWDRSDSCELCQVGHLTGLDGVRPGANLQFVPTLTAVRSDARAHPGGPLEAGTADPQFGLDAQWGVTSNLTVNLTANPDFSQVEADVAQLDVNNRFALFFPEKRPFFLEGADFFGTPIQAVFTRSIVDPVAGGKITGKVGDNAVGFLVARDADPPLIIPGSEFSRQVDLARTVTTAIGRFRRDIGASSTVGALFTHRHGDGYHNRVAGVDAFYRPVPQVTVQLQQLRSSTRYPGEVARVNAQESGTFSGDATAVQANWSSRGWLVAAQGRRYTPGFRADAGFQTQAGTAGGSLNVIRRFWGDPGNWYRQLRLQAGTWRTLDWDRHQLNGGVWLGVHYFGPAQSFVGIWPNFLMKEHYRGRTYTGMAQVYFSVRAQPGRSISLGVNGDVGDVVDYANALPGHQLRISPFIDWRLGRNVDLGVQHTVQRLTRTDTRVFTANLSQVRAVYNFSPRSFVRAVVQYRSTDVERAAYATEIREGHRTLFTQLLYSFKVNPQTVLFAGYSDDRDGWVEPGGREVGLGPKGRVFFLKLGYAFRP